ncbi:hypothetical protein E2C01_099642 [Portunus trituberculatus]|uniref:Uncharacterized protein n=1 Tax=Portunus trituberculatus TaxID=210409 RepID=A0A5B7KFW0_PORTR|nr:hypothetical protein [Portunus trituberculatus]
MEQHTTNKCTMPETHTVCSECASDKHTWKTCTASTKKCLNCHGPHRTLANKCPMMKKIKEDKRKQNKNNGKTYSQATQNATNSNNTNTNNINFEKDTATKILTCILHSHMLNMANPGSYSDELNKLFKLNNLPTINLPPNPPSQNILSLTAACKINTIEDQEASEPDEDQEEEIEEEVENSLATTQALEKVTPPQPTPTPKIQGKYIDLKLITKRTAGWQEELEPIELKNNIKKGIYKKLITKRTAGWQEELEPIELKNNIKKGIYKFTYNSMHTRTKKSSP